MVSYTAVSPLPPEPEAVCSLLHLPAGHPGPVLPATLPCGARTFLSGRSRRGRPADSEPRTGLEPVAFGLPCRRSAKTELSGRETNLRAGLTIRPLAAPIKHGKPTRPLAGELDALADAIAAVITNDEMETAPLPLLGTPDSDGH